jgi:hypothetical protein
VATDTGFSLALITEISKARGVEPPASRFEYLNAMIQFLCPTHTEGEAAIGINHFDLTIFRASHGLGKDFFQACIVWKKLQVLCCTSVRLNSREAYTGDRGESVCNESDVIGNKFLGLRSCNRVESDSDAVGNECVDSSKAERKSSFKPREFIMQ